MRNTYRRTLRAAVGLALAVFAGLAETVALGRARRRVARYHV